MKRCTIGWLLLGLLVLMPSSVRAQERTMDLALVPPDALAFIHVDIAGVWKSDLYKDIRETVDKAGAKALAAFDDRFFPRPSSLSRVTLVWTSLTAFGPGEPVVILGTSQAIDKASFLKFTVPGAKETELLPGGPLYADSKKNMEFYFADSKTLVVGSSGNVQALIKRDMTVKGNLRAALAKVNAKVPIVAAINVEAIPPQALALAPPPLQPLLKAKLAVVAIDLSGMNVNLSLAYGTAQQTVDADNAAQEGIKLVRAKLAEGKDEFTRKVRGNGKPGSLEELPEAAGSLFVLGLLNRVDKFLAASPIKKQGNSLVATVKVPAEAQAIAASYSIALAFMVPAVQKVRASASRIQGTNNLKQMALAMHTYHDQFRKLPAAAICDKNGKPLLSWRVAILPYVEQNELYQQFKLDEPWNSEHNRKLIPRMPHIYVNPSAPFPDGETCYRVFVGDGAGFEPCKGLTFRDFTDGTSNTLMIVEAAASVPWTKPAELVYDAKKPLPKFGNFHGNGSFSASLFDGSVRMIPGNISEQTLRALITRSANDVPGKDFD